jgi:hypothetical protein
MRTCPKRKRLFEVYRLPVSSSSAFLSANEKLNFLVTSPDSADSVDLPVQ